MVVLTGDIHTSWANEVPNGREVYTPSTAVTSCGGTQAVEFDYNGQIIRTLETQAVEGTNHFAVDLTGLAPGPYMIGIHQLYSDRSGNGVVVKMK